MRDTPSMSPASSREKGSGTAMDPSMFSTLSRVRSPVLGGVTASSTGGFFSLSSKIHLINFRFIFIFLSLSLLLRTVRIWCVASALPMAPARSPLDYCCLLRGGLYAHGEPVATGE